MFQNICQNAETCQGQPVTHRPESHGASLPATLVGSSWLPPIPRVVRHSSRSFSSSSAWLSPASRAGSRDRLRPLSLSFHLCPEALNATGEEVQGGEGLLVGLTATHFPWANGTRGVEVEGAPFLPNSTCPLTAAPLSGFLCGGLTPKLVDELPEPTSAGGRQSGAGVGCDFFPPARGEGETGTTGERCGEVGGRSWGPQEPGTTASGEAGGVWKLSTWFPGENKQFPSVRRGNVR